MLHDLSLLGNHDLEILITLQLTLQQVHDIRLVPFGYFQVTKCVGKNSSQAAKIIRGFFNFHVSNHHASEIRRTLRVFKVLRTEWIKYGKYQNKYFHSVCILIMVRNTVVINALVSCCAPL